MECLGVLYTYLGPQNLPERGEIIVISADLCGAGKKALRLTDRFKQCWPHAFPAMCAVRQKAISYGRNKKTAPSLTA